MKKKYAFCISALGIMSLVGEDAPKKMALCPTAARQLIQRQYPEAYAIPGCKLPPGNEKCQAQVTTAEKALTAWKQSPEYATFKSAFDAYNAVVNETETSYFSHVAKEKEQHDAAIKASSDTRAAALKSAKDAWEAAIKAANHAYAQARHEANKPHEQTAKSTVKSYNDAVQEAGKKRAAAIDQAWKQFKSQRSSWTMSPKYKEYKKAFDALQACHKAK